MMNKLIELKNKIINSELIVEEDDERFARIVEDSLREMYFVGIKVGWKSCGEKIVRAIRETK